MGYFSTPKCPDWFWGPSSVIRGGYQGVKPPGERRCVTLTNHFHVMPLLRMSGDVPPLPHMT